MTSEVFVLKTKDGEFFRASTHEYRNSLVLRLDPCFNPDLPTTSFLKISSDVLEPPIEAIHRYCEGNQMQFIGVL